MKEAISPLVPGSDTGACWHQGHPTLNQVSFSPAPHPAVAADTGLFKLLWSLRTSWYSWESLSAAISIITTHFKRYSSSASLTLCVHFSPFLGPSAWTNMFLWSRQPDPSLLVPTHCPLLPAPTNTWQLPPAVSLVCHFCWTGHLPVW